jgi:hypothetical protein
MLTHNSDEILVAGNTVTLCIGITDCDDFYLIVVPKALRIVKAVLVRLINEIITALVTGD